MDGDPAVESALDSFSRILPLPYRVGIVIVMGVWGWGTNLQYLSLNQICLPKLIKYPHRASPRTDPSHHLSTYRLALVLTIPLIFSLLLFWLLSHRNKELVIYYDFLPISYLCFLFAFFVLPLRQFSRSGRSRFLHSLRRVLIGGLAETKDGKFGDILLADVLTSYAKILADLFVAFCMFFQRGGSATSRPDRGCGGQFIVPLIIAAPYLMRFRQCIIEYFRVRESNRKAGGIGSQGWGGEKLANALKYSTAFPVIILSALQRHLSNNAETIGLTEKALYRCWLVAVCINSFYSFYWDVTKDWDLTLFSSARNSHMHAYGLRPCLLFRARELYYVVIAIDFILRCTWSLKLSPHLDHFADFESGIFLMVFLEVFRRWIWIFFRVEAEWIRNSMQDGGLGTDGQHDILLDNYGTSLLGDYDSGKDNDDD